MLNDPFDCLAPRNRQRMEMPRGAHVFRQGDPTRGMYRVVSGIVTLQRLTETGATIVLHRAAAGSVVAEASLFAEAYHCDAICSESTTVLRFDKSAVLQALRENPAFALSFARLMATQVQQSRQIIELMSIRSAEKRVLAAVELGMLDGTVTEFAARISLTHEACYRALKSLTKKRLVQKTGRGAYQVR